jgi:GT2 family glycosyltransferase
MTSVHERTPTVSVVIPHYSDLRRLDLCLAALERQSYPRDEFEIIVGDNNSPEGIAAVEAVAAGRARVTKVVQKGPGPARNGAVELARGDILAFTDSDCIPEPDWLVEGVAALKRSDFVGGRMKVLVEDPRNMTPAEAFESVFAFDNRGYVERKGFSVTANLFCPRSVFDAVGGFYTGVSTEDLEWCHRARDAGYRIGYAPASVVGHPARRTWSELLTKARRMNVDMYGHITRDGGGRVLWALKCLAMPFSALAHTPRALFSGNLHSLQDRLKVTVALFVTRFVRMADGLGLLWRAEPPS